MSNKNKVMLLLRYTDSKKRDFISEHRKVLENKNCVWMLKVGKLIPEAKAEMVINEGGHLILRGPKSTGGKCYYAKVEKIYNGSVRDGMVYPEYYDSLIEDDMYWFSDSLEGTWFKITELREIDKKKVEGFKLLSNDHRLEEVLNSTRSSIMYVYSEQEI